MTAAVAVMFLFTIGISAAVVGAVRARNAGHPQGAHACGTRSRVSVAQLQKRLAADSLRVPVSHDAPLASFTVAQAHCAMLAHRDCDFRRCPCKAAAWEIVRPRIRSAVPGMTR